MDVKWVWLWVFMVKTLAGQAQETTNAENTTTPAKPASAILKTGDSYLGLTPSTHIANLTTGTVAVLLTVDNWSRWAVLEPQSELTCGEAVTKIPEIIKPGMSEMVLFQKKSGYTGVCGVVTWRMELPISEPPQYIQVMFSVPYSLNSFASYAAVGIADSFLNATGLFEQLYYYNGPFQRAEAGQMVEFQNEIVKVRASLEPDTYTPVLTMTILPLRKEDQFRQLGKQPYSAKPLNQLNNRGCNNYSMWLPLSLVSLTTNLGRMRLS